ncbi:hypothetical protein QJS83_08015 [Bdellovibrio sp. 22V]|uniref:hypothetical protein n=1 Tax=Bdellovibrio sp. 22V TaxID=3044166 RepID=UPI002543C101|nr:hypothetical protein [Bdellovibrio sp. 22V]WII73821.1 hypothetical protein QJS83_08015 [Bdellovibrio sp. 22V]
MKTAQLFSALILSSALLTTACTPKDEAITDPATRNKILEQKNRRQGKTSNGQKRFQIGFFAISSLLVDKEVEAVELVRLALEKDNGTKSNAKLTDKAVKENGYTAKLSLSSETLEYVTDKGTFKTNVAKNLDVVVAEGKVTISGKKLKQSLDKARAENEKKTYANLSEESFEVTLQDKAGDDSAALITLTSAGTMNAAVEENGSKENVKIQVALVVDKESLNTENVKVLSTKSVMSLVKNNGRTLDVKIEGENHELSMVGLCNEVKGSAKITTDKKGKFVTFQDETVEVAGSSFKSTIATCGKRPTVDLSRLLLL